MRIPRALMFALFLLAVLYVVLAVLAQPRPGRTYVGLGVPGVAVMAHAGGDGLWPGNTMRAFDGAQRLGVDVLEIDMHKTSDGVLVAIHDDTVDRTTDGTGSVSQLTLGEIQALDAAYRWTPEGTRLEVAPGAALPYRGTGVTVPAISEVLRAFDIGVNIDIKQHDEATAQELCRLIAAEDAVDRVMVASFSAPTLNAFRRACPQVATSASPREVVTFFALATLRLAAAYSPPFDALQVPVSQSGLRVVTPQFVRAAHSRGVEVHVWTIDDVDEMRELIAMGVDGIITDRPDRALTLLQRPVDGSLLPQWAAVP